jgi:hypothetical protein
MIPNVFIWGDIIGWSGVNRLIVNYVWDLWYQVVETKGFHLESQIWNTQ